MTETGTIQNLERKQGVLKIYVLLLSVVDKECQCDFISNKGNIYFVFKKEIKAYKCQISLACLLLYVTESMPENLTHCCTCFGITKQHF